MLAAGLLAACSSDNGEEPKESEMVTVNVNLGGFAVTQEEMATRETSPVADICTHLDVWIYDSGGEVSSYQQDSGHDGFGTLSLTLNNQNEYTIYAVAHKANGAATLSDGVVLFPDDKVTHSFFVSRAFKPTNDMSLNLTMNRIVAQFQFNTTDALPDWCKTIRVTISNVFDRWNVAGYGVHELNRVSTINIASTHDDGTVTCNVYAIANDAQTFHDILIEGLDVNGDVKESHTLTNLPLKNNQRTIATGNFFTDAASSFFFTAEEWAGEVAYDF